MLLYFPPSKIVVHYQIFFPFHVSVNFNGKVRTAFAVIFLMLAVGVFRLKNSAIILLDSCYQEPLSLSSSSFCSFYFIVSEVSNCQSLG